MFWRSAFSLPLDVNKEAPGWPVTAGGQLATSPQSKQRHAEKTEPRLLQRNGAGPDQTDPEVIMFGSFQLWEQKKCFPLLFKPVWVNLR